MAENINWNEATQSDGFVKIEQDKEKILVLTNYRLVKVDKFGEENIEFQADVLEEDGVSVNKKLFTMSSRRAKVKLRPIFENKKTTDIVKLSILKVGDRYDTQYSIKELTK